MSVYVHVPGSAAGSASPSAGATDLYFGLRTDGARFTGGAVMPPSFDVDPVPPPPWVAPSPASPPIGDELVPAPPFMPLLLPVPPVPPGELGCPPVPVFMALLVPLPPVPLLMFELEPPFWLTSSSPFDEQP